MAETGREEDVCSETSADDVEELSLLAVGWEGVEDDSASGATFVFDVDDDVSSEVAGVVSVDKEVEVEEDDEGEVGTAGDTPGVPLVLELRLEEVSGSPKFEEVSVPATVLVLLANPPVVSDTVGSEDPVNPLDTAGEGTPEREEPSRAFKTT